MLTLQGCAQSDFGNRLAATFEESSEKKSEELDSDKKNGESKTIRKIVKKKKDEIKISEDSKASIKISRKLSRDKIRRKNNFVPHPYRITIRLSGTDPEAPAEIVTEALRMSGVTFEVEKIERINPNSSLERRTLGGRVKP